MSTPYLFVSKRLGFRNWQRKDLSRMAAINANAMVMEHFPSVLTREETAHFLDVQKQQFIEKEFCYFAVERLDTEDLIGFIGLSQKTFRSDFTPCIDIGWRLSHTVWGKGFATEGAQRCLLYGFDTLQLKEIKAICPVVNYTSERVMQKIGMQKVGNFLHPLLKGDSRLQNCIVYEIKKELQRIELMYTNLV